MTLIEAIREQKSGRGDLMTNASDESLSQRFNQEFGEENTLDGICWDDDFIYDIGCYDGANSVWVISRNPPGGRKV
jgi:hypothetical protein